MGIRFIEVSKLRIKRWRIENKRAKSLGIVSLPLEILKNRRFELNAKKYRSEVWFQQKLELKFGHLNLNVHKNFNILNRFFADFFIFEQSLVIEIDGSIHDDQKEYDQRRDLLFSKAGYTVLRVTAYDELGAFRCLNKIHEILNIPVEPIYKPKPKTKFKKPFKEFKRATKTFQKQARSKAKEKRMAIIRKKHDELNNAAILWSLGKGPSPYTIK
jgi:very-short-patch-repair endonuclease